MLQPFFRRFNLILLLGFAFELSLGLIAIVWLWLVDDLDSLGQLPKSFQLLKQLIAGLLIAGASVGVILLLRTLLPGFFARLAGSTSQFRDWMRSLSTFEIAILSAAAGWGEELLFRRAIQDSLYRWLEGSMGAKLPPAAIALMLASALFGLAHFLNKEYFLYAFAFGIVLGVIYWQAESLIPTIVAHTIYDFIAIRFLIRSEWFCRDTVRA